MTNSDHNRLIKNAARSLLRPLGCVQQGTSRTWIDSQTLWAGVIEFQPSSFGKGSFLNVGACWLWAEKDYVSFDDGYRVEQFSAFESEAQFAEVATALAMRARDEILALRARFASMALIAAHLKRKGYSNVWDNYHAAVAAALTNDTAHAAKRFAAVAAEVHSAPWVDQLKGQSAALASMSNNPAQFREAIKRIVERSKARLKIA